MTAIPLLAPQGMMTDTEAPGMIRGIGNEIVIEITTVIETVILTDGTRVEQDDIEKDQ